MTGHQVAIANIYQLWLHLRAERHDFVTAGVEATAWGRLNGAGHSSLQDDPFLFNIGIGDRSRGEQGFSVRVKGSAKDRFRWDPNNTFVLGADGAGIVEAQGADRDGSALLRQRTKPCPLSQSAACQILS